MRENMKRRLAVFLCLVFVLPAVLAVLPQTAQEVQAATTYMYWYGMSSNGETANATVEAGAKFYIGDYVQVYSGSVSSTAYTVKASYTTSKKNVAAVNSKGYVEAKAVGTTDIKVKYKGKTLTCVLKVVKAGSFGTKKSYTQLANAAAKVAKNIPSKITTKNGFDLLKQMAEYDKVAGSVSADVSSTGFASEQLVVPQAGRVNTLRQALYAYSSQNSPLSTTSSKVIKIASASATASKVTIKLKKAPTKEQILAMKIIYGTSSQNESAGNNKVYFSMYLTNKNQMSDYSSAIACMSTGSKTITLTPQKYNSSKGKYVNTKLKKGATYSLGSKADWTKGKTVKVK